MAYGAYNSFYTVEGGHRALLFNRLVGVKEEVQVEGMHFMIPWFEMPIIYDVRPKPRMIQSLTGSKGERGGLFRLTNTCDTTHVRPHPHM